MPFESVEIPLHYFVETRPWEGRHELEEIVMQAIPEPLHEEALTWGDYLRAQGREEGRREGRKEGRVEGRRSMLSRLLLHRFEEVPPALAERIGSASPEELDRFEERVLDARTLEDVVGDDR